MKKFVFIFLILIVSSCSRITTKCIDNHEYYKVSNYGFYYSIAPKLNDDGTPVKCDKE